VSVYPNPVEDILYINGISNDSEIVLYNNMGQSIDYNRTNNSIDCSMLSQGIYLLKLYLPNGSYKTIPVLKQ
jgi:hypothetical protein